jgi:Raf kinase inhibitor-like YbhB/YbcL family protein
MPQSHPSGSGKSLLLQRVQTAERGALALSCPAMGPDGRIGDIYAACGDNLSPPLEWTATPGAETFALIVEDPDAHMDKPFLHWVVWNIPGYRHDLPRGIHPGQEIRELGGLVQGRNSIGVFGYMGPRPPIGDGPHHYHFELFALDRRINLPSIAPLEALVNSLKSAALASCELVGTYEQASPGPQPEQRSFAPKGDERGGLDEDDADRTTPHVYDDAVESDGGPKVTAPGT